MAKKFMSFKQRQSKQTLAHIPNVVTILVLLCSISAPPLPSLLQEIPLYLSLSLFLFLSFALPVLQLCLFVLLVNLLALLNVCLPAWLPQKTLSPRRPTTNATYSCKAIWLCVSTRNLHDPPVRVF